MDYQSLFDRQERDRATWVIDKARRNSWNVIETLVTHMVAKTLIEELTGELPTQEKRVRKDKTQELRGWVLKNLGKEFGTIELSKKLDCSYDTALKTIKENPFYFVKVRRGYYEIRDGEAERIEAKKNQ